MQYPRLREVERLKGIQGLMDWDEATMMPEGGNKARGLQKAALAGVVYEKSVNPELARPLGELISALEGSTGTLTDKQSAVVRDAKRDYEKSTRKTKAMASREAELATKSYTTWVTARKEKSWSVLAPVLSEVVELKKEISEATSPSLGAYDAMLDEYERGMTSERVNEVLSELKEGLIPLIKKISAAVEADPSLNEVCEPLQGGDDWDVKKQEELSKLVAERLGFEMDHGRLDVSVHPFTGGPAPSDVRITTRYSTEDWLEGIGATVHEVGHGLCEQGRPAAEFEDLPVSRVLSMGVHESQSLLWERMVFLNKPFWKFLMPLLHEHFPHTASCTAEDGYKAANRVTPGLVRVQADEVTYHLHIILRYEIESQLMSGDISIADVPGIWNEKMKSLLGVDVPSDLEGALQDIHWPLGALGYFPSYSLGAIMACQIYEKALSDIPGLEDQLAQGNFALLREWLRENIHSVGSLYESPDQLLTVVTGEALDPGALVRHLEKK
ncbi:unnamed protein product [Chrysoparadoxa australica]